MGLWPAISLESLRMAFDERLTSPGNADLQIGNCCRASGNVWE